MNLFFYGESNLGKIRKNNEDAFLVKEIREGVFLFIVADGMGGHNKGEFASKAATFEISGYIERHIKEFWSEDIDNGLKSLKSMICKSVYRANENIFHYASTRKEYFEMGTTAVLGLLFGNRLIAANVGDSRLYIKTKDQLKQITVDNSYTQELISNGIITKEEARTHEKKNIILRAIGTEADIEVDLYDVELENGDKIIFCTDGLTDMLEDSKIDKVVTCCEEPRESVKTLITEANNAGGIDNITVVIANYLD